jgi:hypothetical protein
VGQDLGPRGRQLRVGDRHLTVERVRRFVFGLVLFLVILFAVMLLLQAVQDAPGDEVTTVTEEG